MDLSVIEINPAEARARLTEYQEALRIERNAEDEAIAAGFRAAARGLPFISLQRTITAGGWHDNSLPKIAVAPAAATACFVRWHNGDLVFSDVDDRYVNRSALVNEHSVRVPVPGDARPPRRPSSWQAGEAMVPLIPPRFRPAPRRLHRFHLLWEVPSWTWIPPEDPALIKHVRGDLWTVHAVWELTELERLVLAQR